METTGGEAGRDLSVAEVVGLAVRAHRRELGLSQRRYAARRGWTKSHVSRLECAAGTLRLDDIVAALVGTGFAVVLQQQAGRGMGDRQSWPRTDLVARDRGGRRFPAHREVRRVARGPLWWWRNEATDLRSRPPLWSAEGLTLREVLDLHEDLLRGAAERLATGEGRDHEERDASETGREALSPPPGAARPTRPPGPP